MFLVPMLINVNDKLNEIRWNKCIEHASTDSECESCDNKYGIHSLNK